MEQQSIIIENNLLKAKINPQGAELQSLYHKDLNLEFIWNADPKYWAKHSPVLFPIVGALKENTFYYQDKPYKLSRHGFARELKFEVEDSQADRATFTLRSSAETKENYPFDFVLKLHYSLKDASLELKYEVLNESGDKIYFSIGAHPAFKVPLTEDTEYNDYYLEFNKVEEALRWGIAAGGLIGGPEVFLNDQARIHLTKELFHGDAIVLKNLESNRISLLSEKTQRGLNFDFEGFPFLGIWAAKDAPFVCIEPWCGIADSVNHNQKLEEKEGIIELEGKSNWTRAWKVELF